MTHGHGDERREHLLRLLSERRRDAESRYRRLLDQQQSGEAAGDSEGVHGWKASREGGVELGLIETLDRTLRQIDDAVAKLHAGRYGVCSSCGEPIPIGRLDALPFATRCVPCQETIEKTR